MTFTSKLWPDAQILDESAANFALNMVRDQLRNQTWTYCTREELLEAAVALSFRLDYLWENGGRDAFQAMLNREFGDRAITVK